ncbi:MAG: hypothetical protein J6Z12_01305 [Paludibacteraceae bacterium]|nr:hypothetical protein [Paludibacteraceae bacterium]
MKKYTILLTLLPLLLAGCDNEPANQQTGKLGEIELSRTRVGVGQAVVATLKEVEEPVGTVTNRSMTWNLNGVDLVSDDNYYADGVFSRTFYPDQTGLNTLVFNVDYVYKVQGADGIQIRSASMTRVFDVEPCDVRTSFWGDNAAMVCGNEWHCKLQMLSDHDYTGTYTPIYGKPLYLYYYFDNDRLTAAEEKQYQVLTAMADYANFVTAFLVFKDTMDARYNEGAVAELTAEWTSPTAQETAAWTAFKASYDAGERKFISVDDERLMGQAMVDGRLQLQAAYVTGARTDMRLCSEPCPLTGAPSVFFSQYFTPKSDSSNE